MSEPAWMSTKVEGIGWVFLWFFFFNLALSLLLLPSFYFFWLLQVWSEVRIRRERKFLSGWSYSQFIQDSPSLLWELPVMAVVYDISMRCLLWTVTRNSWEGVWWTSDLYFQLLPWFYLIAWEKYIAKSEWGPTFFGHKVTIPLWGQHAVHS